LGTRPSIKRKSDSGRGFNPAIGAPNITRLNTDGSPDTTFLTGTGPAGKVYALAVQSDDRILIGGAFTSVNNRAMPYLARLNADGSLDPSFVFGFGPNNHVLSLALQSDGRIIVGGSFTEFSGLPHTNIVRLNTNGTLDETFQAKLSRAQWDPWVSAVAVDAQDRVLVVGDLHFVDGVGRRNIARLAPNGALDTSFVPPAGADAIDDVVYSVVPLPSGKVLIGGYFSQIGGATRNGFAQLNADGSVDNSFAPTLGQWSAVESAIAAQRDGKIIIGGYFADQPRAGVRRLNQDGSIDASFATTLVGTRSEWISSVLVHPDGFIIVGGDFNEFGDTLRHNVARLSPAVQPALRVSVLDSNRVRLSWPAALSNCIPESTAIIPSTEWHLLPAAPVRVGNEFVVTNESLGAPQFFRLRQSLP
jgi:uncharacterized delta-60 repeat protein